MSVTKPLQRASLHQELVVLLRDMIVEGQLKPGEKVPERALCESFGVSRTPMREALKVLATDGLVVLQTNRGAWVSELTLEELEEVFPVMGALEALAGRLACDRMTDARLARIETLHARMLAHFEDRDRAAYFATNEKIHAAILDAAENPTLTTQYLALSARIRRARYVANMSEARWHQAVAEHEEILAALKARDGDHLSEVLTRHLENKFQTVSEWITRQDPSPVE